MKTATKKAPTKLQVERAWNIGLRKFAAVLENAQLTRGELLNLGASVIGTKKGNRIILLANLLSKMNDAVKDEFCKLTLENE